MNSYKNIILVLFIFVVYLCNSQTNTAAYKTWEENFNLGYQFYNNNQYSEAEKYFEKALNASKNAFKQHAEEPISTLYYYAYCKYLRSQFEEALNLFKEILLQAQNLSKRDYNFEIKVWGDIASTYSTLGETIKAITEQNKLNEFIKTSFGEKSEIYASNSNKLGQMYFALGDCKTASHYYIVAKNLLIKLNLRTIDLAIVNNNLGLCSFNYGEYTNADNLYYESLIILEELQQEETLFTQNY